MKKKLFYIIFALFTILIACSKTTKDLRGNWSMVTNNSYYEIKIDSFSITTFHSGSNFWPRVKNYKIEKDSFFLDLISGNEYKIHYLIDDYSKNSIILKAKNDTITLIKRKENDLTFDKINDSIKREEYIKAFHIRMTKIMDSINNHR